MNLESSSVEINWRSPWEFHYPTDFKSAMVPGDLILYDPMKQMALGQTIIPCPGLVIRDDPCFDPHARKISQRGSNGAFSVRSDGIYLSDPWDVVGLVEHLQLTGGLNKVFQPRPLPEIRWENARLIPEDETQAWAEYVALLRSLYGNGFVRLKRYRIAESMLNDRLLYKWPVYLNGSHIPFLELMRNPVVEADFDIAERNDAMLADPSNWRRLSPFLFSGWLTQVLHDGGVYEFMCGDRLPAAQKASENVFQELNRDYRNFELWVTNRQWMEALCGLKGDHTWIIFDREARSLVILMGTDSD